MEWNLGEAFGGASLSTEEDGDFFLAIIDSEFGFFNDQRPRRVNLLRFLRTGSTPDQNDNAADEHRDGGS